MFFIHEPCFSSRVVVFTEPPVFSILELDPNGCIERRRGGYQRLVGSTNGTEGVRHHSQHAVALAHDAAVWPATTDSGVLNIRGAGGSGGRSVAHHCESVLII